MYGAAGITLIRGDKGFVDVIPVEDLPRWEQGFHAHLAHHHVSVMEDLKIKKALDADIEEGLKKRSPNGTKLPEGRI